MVYKSVDHKKKCGRFVLYHDNENFPANSIENQG